MKMKKLIVIAIIIVAFLLRFWDLKNTPSGLFDDEASFLVNAVSILHTGKDEDARAFPLYLKSFIDPKPALYSYAQIPFVAVLGPTTTAARLPALLFGLISILFFYLLLRVWVKEHIAILGTIIISISPWHINLSRGSQEVIMAFCFSIISLYVFSLLYKTKQQIFMYVLFFITLMLSYYSYPSVKVFLPSFFFTFLIISLVLKQVSIKKALGLLAIICLSIISIIPITDTTRFTAVSIFTSPATQLILNEKIATATGHAPGMAIRLFNNKLVDYSYLFLNNYATYFSGNFLFFGDNQPTRYQIPFTGILFPFEIIFLSLGIFWGFIKKEWKESSLFMFVLLLTAPLAASATSQEVPSITRTFPMLISLLYFITIGITNLLQIYEKKQRITFLLAVLISVLYICNFGYFWFNYTIQQANYHPWYRKYEEEQLASEIKKIENKYNAFYINNTSYTYFVLDNQISINDLQHLHLHREDSEFSIDKFHFINKDCYIRPYAKTLFALKQTCRLDSKQKKVYKLVGTIRFKDKNPAYFLYEYTPYNVLGKINHR